ncbi:Indole-3-glycerol-phosphate synthase [Melioribacter roseus P3M-2]|uniref:Indole-3-glycerol phosphate synthase n=1 Tax=Melioribacter roseus (strain DSM 23840 / JCM 17771 / VKM B-2668 / P3M-2) TaxID=1191523 RepID=I7A478_MELRP|nr:indole-3-glycerol phosphate synthase TrpC [Melioribacter roseus]AFN76013.1 Indole-3-glycerol-phosphate synthase [Melioribacter roseus P3M-2]
MSFLEQIINTKKEEIKNLHNRYSLSFFEEQEFFHSSTLSLVGSLFESKRLGLIAEIKKASPSKGILRADFNHAEIAKIYMNNKVNAISVLTDSKYFKGSIEYLKEIAKFKTVPLLRKDFIIDEYQIFEAKASGADVVLLIGEALSAEQSDSLIAAASECNLEILYEIHSPAQLDKIDFDKIKLIGINNRNLDTFEVDIRTTRLIADMLPEGTVAISESGINTPDDIKIISHPKVKGLLVGEYFMKSEDIDKTLKQFINILEETNNEN